MPRDSHPAARFDRRGKTKDLIRSYQSAKNSVSFEEVYLKFLKKEEKKRHDLLCNIPRNLEAALSETLQIATAGEYSGLMDADHDYLKLEEDCSNIEQVLKISSCKLQEFDHQRYKEKILDCRELRLVTHYPQSSMKLKKKSPMNQHGFKKADQSLVNEFREYQSKNYRKTKIK